MCTIHGYKWRNKLANPYSTIWLISSRTIEESSHNIELGLVFDFDDLDFCWWITIFSLSLRRRRSFGDEAVLFLDDLLFVFFPSFGVVLFVGTFERLATDFVLNEVEIEPFDSEQHIDGEDDSNENVFELGWCVCFSLFGDDFGMLVDSESIDGSSLGATWCDISGDDDVIDVGDNSLVGGTDQSDTDEEFSWVMVLAVVADDWLELFTTFDRSESLKWK